MLGFADVHKLMCPYFLPQISEQRQPEVVDFIRQSGDPGVEELVCRR